MKQELEYNWILDLSAAGLIYCHFGRDILRNVLSQYMDVTAAIVIDEFFKIVYVRLIKEIDVRDNGPQIYSSSCTDLSTRIYRLNPWSDSRDEEKDQQFEKAMALVREEFLEVVQNAIHVDYPQTGFLQLAVGNRFVVDWSGEIIILPANVPASVLCEDLLSYIEEDMNVSSSIKYIILDPINCRNYDYYKVACIALRRYSEEYRMLLPREWAGLEYNALVEACGVECAVHVVPDRRIGFVETLYGAIAMAREALKIGKTAQSEE
ncbi:MYG1 exonuclease-like [Temnothorax nylanderi]|uniref:MYG1 exonuclease-like n=1 Tax=Temnothorax nylanderi TaxID=102681 RepID=UPI003A859789